MQTRIFRRERHRTRERRRRFAGRTLLGKRNRKDLQRIGMARLAREHRTNELHRARRIAPALRRQRFGQCRIRLGRPGGDGSISGRHVAPRLTGAVSAVQAAPIADCGTGPPARIIRIATVPAFLGSKGNRVRIGPVGIEAIPWLPPQL
jgi:hypothetical protein